MRATNARPVEVSLPGDAHTHRQGPLSVEVRSGDRPAITAPVARARAWLAIPCGMAAGAVWGTVARVWMRWVSTDPEFSWAGTLMIILAFSVFGTVNGAAAAFRLRRTRRWLLTPARVGGVVATMPLFFGAGAAMLPTVIAGGLAVWRRDWPGWLRALAGTIGCLPVLAVAWALGRDFGVLGAAARLCGLTGIYGVIVAATWAALAPYADGWRAPRALRRLGLLAAVVVLCAVSVGVVGFR